MCRATVFLHEIAHRLQVLMQCLELRYFHNFAKINWEQKF